MPNVPNVPGVPALVSYAVETFTLLTGDSILGIGSFVDQQWGIYLDGDQAFPYQSIVDFDYKQDWPVSDYTVEDGGFQSYDKVQLPFDIKVRVVSGGSAIERQDLLTAVLDASNSLNLYDVVTPEQTFSSCNITHIDYKRTAYNGVGLLMIDIWFIEVRVTSTTTYSTTQSPTTAGKVGTGSVTPQTPSSSVQQSFSDGNWSVQ
jgi:hypothetical protein